MKYDSKLVQGTLVKRYKRFLADVVLDDGTAITVHCPNTGAMTACADPGSRVWLWDSQNPKRKYRYSWEWTTVLGRRKACVNTARANQLVAEALEAHSLLGIDGYQRIDREPRVEDGRLDFLLHGSDNALDSDTRCQHYIEVKSVTLPLHSEENVAAFPDAVTARGLKHLRRLQTLAQQGYRTTLLFCVALEGVEKVRPAWLVDPSYAEGLQQAMAVGVNVLAYGVSFGVDGMALEGQAPLSFAINQPNP